MAVGAGYSIVAPQIACLMWLRHGPTGLLANVVFSSIKYESCHFHLESSATSIQDTILIMQSFARSIPCDVYAELMSSNLTV